MEIERPRGNGTSNRHTRQPDLCGYLANTERANIPAVYGRVLTNKGILLSV